MPEDNLPSFDSLGEVDTVVDHLHREGLATQTIDLSGLLCSDDDSQGTVDVSGVRSTSFGRLLDALPMPAILIDQLCRVVFSNQACAKLSCDYLYMPGNPFLDFVPRPSDKDKAQVLADKTLALLTRVFKTRRPLTAEAILEIHGKRIWARLNLRAVKIASDRYVLALIEDVTSAKKQLELNRRRNKESEELRRDLEALVDIASSDLAVANVRLKREIAEHLKTQQMLRAERQKCEILAQQADLATAVVAPTGTFQRIDNRFQELCGYELDEVPNLKELIIHILHHQDRQYDTARAWLDSFSQAESKGTGAVPCAVTCRGSVKREVRVTGLKLEDGNYFIACDTGHDRHQQQPMD